MEAKQDEALTIPNARLLSAVYFGLLAIVATIIFDSLLYAIGFEQLMPISKAILLAVIIAVAFGALFGERIVHSHKPYHKHAFLWAFFMVLIALPVYNLGFIYLLKENHHELFSHTTFVHLAYLYLFVLLYSFILAGVWLAVVAGLAAIYLRGYLVYYLLETKQKRPKSGHEVEAKKIDSVPEHTNNNDIY